MAVATRTITIEDPVGIHARPASNFSQAAIASGCSVCIAKDDGHSVNANSILSIMGLGIAQGSNVTISVEGDNAESVADHLVAVILANE